MSNLSSLNVGDFIVIESCSTHYNKEFISKIIRKTAKQTITERSRFWTENGRSVGCDAWSGFYARPITDGDVERIKAMKNRRLMLSKIKSVDYNKLTNGQLFSIISIINKNNEK